MIRALIIFCFSTSIAAAAEPSLIGTWSTDPDLCGLWDVEIRPDGTLLQATPDGEDEFQWRLDQRGRLQSTNRSGEWSVTDHSVSRDVLIIDGSALIRCD